MKETAAIEHPPFDQHPQAPPPQILRAKSSISSFRLQAVGGLKHLGEASGNSSSSGTSAIGLGEPSFASMTARCRGMEFVYPSPPRRSRGPGGGVCDNNIGAGQTEIEAEDRNEGGVYDDWAGDATVHGIIYSPSALPSTPPTAVRPPPKAHRSPTSAKYPTSLSRTSSRDSAHSQTDDTMDSQYSSLEQMLAKNGFQDTRVCTPQSVHVREQSSDAYRSSLIRATSASSLDLVTSSSTSSPPKTRPVQTLRTRTSLLQLTSGIINNIWSSQSPAPSSSKTNTTAPAVTSTSAKDRTKAAHINQWLQETAVVAPQHSMPSTVSPPSSSSMLRSSTDSTVESVFIETPDSSPPSTRFDYGFEALGNTTPKPDQERREASSRGYKVEERTAESLLRSSLRHAASVDGSLRQLQLLQQQQEQSRRPSIASIFSFGSNDKVPSVLPTETAVAPVSANTAAVVAELARPEPIARPQPKLLRKTASLHTLRMAASPVVSPAQAQAGAPPSSPPLPQMSTQYASQEATKPVVDASAFARADTPNKQQKTYTPRKLEHRNPRDSPVGETRVVKSSPVSSGSSCASFSNASTCTSDTPRRIVSSRVTSILNDLNDEEGMWTPPKTATTVAAAQSTTARPRQLRAKESLECILASKTAQEKAREQAQRRQRTLDGRKALASLSTFHRNPLPSTESPTESGKRSSSDAKAVAATVPLADGKGSSADKENVKVQSGAGLTGTLKGFAAAAAAAMSASWSMSTPPPSRPSKKAASSSKAVPNQHATMRHADQPKAESSRSTRTTVKASSPAKSRSSLALGRGRHPSRAPSPLPRGGLYRKPIRPIEPQPGRRRERQTSSTWDSSTSGSEAEDEDDLSTSAEEYDSSDDDATGNKERWDSMGRRVVIPKIVISGPAK